MEGERFERSANNTPATILFRAEYSASIGFRGFDEECCLFSQRQQVLIAANQQICLTALSQVEKRLIVFVPAYGHTLLRQLDDLAVGKIFGQ